MAAFDKDNLWLSRQAWKNRSSQFGRSGFTLVELLVVISILAILAVMTVTSINFALSSDRTRGASRQVQSYLAGARDRAIYAKEPRGVRFLIDPDNPTAVTSMVYIAPSPYWIQGVIRMERIDNPPDGTADSPDVKNVRGAGVDWTFLRDRGQLVQGARIRIPGDENGTWYNIDLANSILTSSDQILRLTTPYRDPGTSDSDEVVAFAPGSGPSTYQLELPPLVLSGEEPTLLPSGTGIDLDRSYLPSSWRSTNISPGPDGQPGRAGVNDDGSGGTDNLDYPGEYLWPGSDDYRQYSSHLDLMFSPRGYLSGREAGNGKIHFVIDTLENIQFSWKSDTQYSKGDRVQLPARGFYEFAPYDRVFVCDTGGRSGTSPAIFYTAGNRAENAVFADGSTGLTWKTELNTSPSLLTIFTRTGNVSAVPMYFDAAANIRPDVFYYAETGEAAK